MRRLVRIAASGLIASSAACSSTPVEPGASARVPVYSREAIHAIAFFGVHLGMDAGEACNTFKRAGFSRGRWIDTDVDCSTYPDDESDDTYFGRGPQAATPYGKLSSISLGYRLEEGVRRVRSISVYTDEKGHEDALEAATRAQFGQPTFYARWAYRVLSYGETAEQADFDNMSDFGRCLYRCIDREQAARCVQQVRRFATATIEVVIYDWGRLLRITDERVADHEAWLADLERIHDGTLEILCPPPTVH